MDETSNTVTGVHQSQMDDIKGAFEPMGASIEDTPAPITTSQPFPSVPAQDVPLEGNNQRQALEVTKADMVSPSDKDIDNGSTSFMKNFELAGPAPPFTPEFISPSEPLNLVAASLDQSKESITTPTPTSKKPAKDDGTTSKKPKTFFQKADEFIERNIFNFKKLLD